MSSFLKKRVRVVLVETSHPGNIGAVARSMKTMSLERLYLVNPLTYPNAEATSRASGADDVLAGAQVCQSLNEALEGCSFIVGTSARQRRIEWPLLSARECAQQVSHHASEGDIAIVFGRERSGLKNEELDLCHAMMNIPTSQDYTSLNLASAVQIVAYELFLSCSDVVTRDKNAEERATHEQMEGFFSHLWEALVATEFLDPQNPGQLKRRLRRIYSRAHLTRNEVNTLRGVLTSTLDKTKSLR